MAADAGGNCCRRVGIPSFQAAADRRLATGRHGSMASIVDARHDALLRCMLILHRLHFDVYWRCRNAMPFTIADVKHEALSGQKATWC